MNDKIHQFTLSVYTEDKPGVLFRMSNLFSKRKININSLTVSESEKHGYARFTLTISTTEDKAKLICKQITKIIEVSQAMYYKNSHMFFKELAVFKVEVYSDQAKAFAKLVDQFEAHIEDKVGNVYFLSLTGSETDIDKFKQSLKDYKLLEFVRSGRIAITK
jgi:acetolactate synthase-1/3 small subunit